ncbi:anaerobic sulfatase maturase [Yokenella regensburgei]|uniref:Anaerobic sulfatase-maturating enzyme n=1 Tax=Yokenella regensburgei TaxID=158877 RepID=A0AB38FSF0_9ENTR|nr:anaerobic sulfatase maturase [Yokenella regensburgei]KFD20754.1 putative arylsulfatase regulatory protein [Yokenella regensburgei ATCC 49455]SQA61105.1 Anaerobic sulfatase-maturating enzyme [Yokenella regensburgei]SQA66948.1 Anaerobic sulfatase-maturating enzyme [Yokenella regensburgei]SUQ05392.1 Anaerobic sulfatase-maturating enzyme [Yokenella regensburgei]
MKKSTTIPLTPLQNHGRYLPAYKRRYHMMAKPSGSTCNLDCQYCFYLHKEDLLHQPHDKGMSDEVLEKFIRQYIQSQDGEEIIFSWQGGEPTLMGLDFFEKVIALQKKYQPQHQRIENDFQTNAVLINDKWAAFLKKHNFLVGVSIDGPQEIHDRFRVTRSGKPTFDKVMAGIEALKRHQVPFNALAVVNRVNARFPREVYRFLTRELGATYIQFTPCVEATDFKTTAPQFWREELIPITGSRRAKPGDLDSIVTDWSVDPDDWGTFLVETFDEWVTYDLGRVQVNLFETAVVQTMGLPSQLCITAPFCGKALAIEKNGDVYSCDHYVYPEYRLGNIREHKLAHMVFSERQKTFGMGKKETLPAYCKSCPHLNLCWGECPKNRIVRAPDGEEGLNYLCPGFKHFYKTTKPTLEKIASMLK